MADEDQIIGRLRGISNDEKNEMGKMRCRIDDQARLIMMLKKRNDEYILANMSLDKHAMELERQIEELRDQLDEQQTMKDSIDRQKQTIEQLKGSNFQWEIRDEQARQRFLFNEQQRQSLEQQIDSFKQQINTMDNIIQESNLNTDRVRIELNKQLAERDTILNDQRIQLDRRSKRIEELETQINDKNQQLSRMDEIRLKDLDQAEQKGKQWHDKVKQMEKRLSESLAEQDKLRQQLGQLQKQFFEANQRFIDEEERVNTDLRVKRIEQQLDEKQQRLETLEQEFVAYKNYTAQLLQKEKHLNERLQQLFVGRTTEQ